MLSVQLIINYVRGLMIVVVVVVVFGGRGSSGVVVVGGGLCSFGCRQTAIEQQCL